MPGPKSILLKECERRKQERSQVFMGKSTSGAQWDLFLAFRWSGFYGSKLLRLGQQRKGIYVAN